MIPNVANAVVIFLVPHGPWRAFLMNKTLLGATPGGGSNEETTRLSGVNDAPVEDHHLHVVAGAFMAVSARSSIRAWRPRPAC